MSVATRPIQSPNHSTPKKGEHITIHSQRTHSHQSHYHPPNADPSKTQSSFNTLPSSYLCCALLVSWLVLVMSPAPQQSPTQCLQTLDLCKMKPPHTTATELASLPDMFDQRMFTSFLQQTALLVINYRDNEQTRQTTGQHDNPLGPLLLRHREVRTDQQRVNSHNPVSMIVRRNHSHWDSQTDLTRRDCSIIHPPLMPAEARHDNRSPSPINPSNKARRQQLTSTLVATSRSAYPEITAHPDSWKTSTPSISVWRPQGLTNAKRHSSTRNHLSCLDTTTHRQDDSSRLIHRPFTVSLHDRRNGMSNVIRSRQEVSAILTNGTGVS